ncbi:MAG: pilus assembly protein PilZ [Alishewanella sp. 34-51-39]|nr:MAG: pilus assembly protein PilZ [Alishewanella sp. 34-51-39]
MEELALGFTDNKELYRCYMPFMKNGGLFIRSARHYAWVSPLGAQSSNPAGIGVAFIDDKHNLSNRIEKLLGAMLHSNEATYTM